MAENSAIEWTDHTFSPWTGCSKISPGCQGCYAAHLMDTRMHRVEWGEPGAGEGTRSLMSDDYWRKPLAWNRQAEKDGTRPKVFPSLCDPFDTAVPDQWRHRFFDLMEQTPRLVWLLLTKRIGNVPKLTDPLRGERCLPRNAAIGATFVNQTEWDRDSDKLYTAWAHTGCMFTFGSFEPLLGPIRFAFGDYIPSWVIVGGETTQGAHQARPMHIDWVRSIRNQCAVFKTPFLFKQFGDYGPDDPAPGAHTAMRRMGKRTAGRHLDGRTHDEFPQAAPEPPHDRDRKAG